MINKSMVDAALFRRDTLWKGKKTSFAGMESIVQAAIDETWQPFDPKDEATWPVNGTVGILVECGESPHGYEVCWFEDGTFYQVGVPVQDPAEYALVADLTSHKGETP